MRVVFIGSTVASGILALSWLLLGLEETKHAAAGDPNEARLALVSKSPAATQRLERTPPNRHSAHPAASPGPGGFPLAQLDDAVVSDTELDLPADLVAASGRQPLPQAVPGRRIPPLTKYSDLTSPQLAVRAVPLPQANTLAHVNFQQRRFGRVSGADGRLTLFNPETILVRFSGEAHVSALRVEPGRELDATRALVRRSDVQFAELDTFQRRQVVPDDPLLASQWHHAIIGSFQAWDRGLGGAGQRVAIVDTPFQMNHPDLMANTVAGWDAVANLSVTSAPGIVHSTMCAGLVAAAINNGLGTAGAANCQVLPININGAISEMYNAVIWAATNGVRVVNLSWSGGNSDTLEAAGYFLKTNAGGVLVMSALDGNGYLGWTNQPDIYCISMTDSADNFQGTQYGGYIDFAAPGYHVYSTTTGGGYGYGTGTSYAAPLAAGVIAWLFSLNPTLTPEETIGILKRSAVDLGPAGLDPYYGWGRIDFSRAASLAVGTLPNIVSARFVNGQFSASVYQRAGMSYSLWRSHGLKPPIWAPVANTIYQVDGEVLLLTDPTPPERERFYRLQATRSM